MVSSRIRAGFMNSRVWIGLLVVLAFLLGFLLRGNGGSEPPEGSHAAADHQQATIWTCSMHPQIQLPKPGKCPICFMDLIPLEDSSKDDLGPRALELSEAAAALAEIQTVPAEHRAVTADVRLIGKVNYDETRYRTITAWVAGRIDTLFVDFTGTSVRRGEKLVSLYSPDLFAAQTELFNALTAESELRGSDNAIIRRTATATVASARERLRLWGLTSEQIAEIERRGKPSYHLTIRSPLSGIIVHKNAVEGMYVQTGTRVYTVADLSHVWVTLDAYESDLVWLQEGQTIKFLVEAVPGREFTGTIVFIDPILTEKTRTVMVRLDVDNGNGLLKPGMFVHAVVAASLSGNGRIASAGANELPLVIPASAPLITGKRAIVYVRLPDREKPTFEGREIVLGPRAGNYYVVDQGLRAGEEVVVKGNFKIDSALQIQARPSMMNPDGGGPAPSHQHGSATAPGGVAKSETAYRTSRPDHGREGTSAPPGDDEIPPRFLDQLGDVLHGYVAIQRALAGDDDRAALDAAERTATAMGSVDMGLLVGQVHMAWMQDLERLNTALSSFRREGDISTRREAFQPLSDALWNTLRRFGYRNGEVVRLFHCPMADGGQGADWIQFDRTTANPYYGASMLLCGSQTDSIPALPRDERGQ